MKLELKQLCYNNYNEYYTDNFRLINYYIHKYNNNNATVNIDNKKTYHNKNTIAILKNYIILIFKNIVIILIYFMLVLINI